MYFTAQNTMYVSFLDFPKLFGILTGLYLLAATLLFGFTRSLSFTERILTIGVFGWLLYHYLFWLPIALLLALLASSLAAFTDYISLGLFIAAISMLIYYSRNWTISDNFKKIIITYSLIIFSFNSVKLYELYSFEQHEFAFTEIEETLKAHEPTSRPHIVYIMPDRYASNQSLKAFYNFSNTQFTHSLQQRGFHIWDAQNANYTKTFQSIASTLNMAYLDKAIETIGEEATYYAPIYNVMEDHQTQRILKNIGYYFTHMGNWWDPSRVNKTADLTVSGDSPVSEFISGYLSFTPLSFLKNSRLLKTDNQHACELIEQQRQTIIDQVKQPDPQFIYWHLFTSHPPYIYHPDGSCREEGTRARSSWEERKQLYIEHIAHTNQLIIDLYDQISRDSSRPIIFVVQSDEGPYPWQFTLKRNSFNFWETSDAELKRKFGLMNTIYFPSQNYPDFAAETTPINNFRLILSEIYGIDLPRLKHRSYSFEHHELPYQLKEITDRLKN